MYAAVPMYICKTEVCFPWSANNKWYSTFAVSANVPIYAISDSTVF